MAKLPCSNVLMFSVVLFRDRMVSNCLM